MLSVGLTLQAIAPVLFLVNILSAVFSSRRNTRDRTDLRNSSFGTDRLARRGTDIALIIFIVGAWWMALAALFGQTYPEALEPQGAILLVYYGWIAGTVLAVSLHLLPRLTQLTGLGRKATGIGQALWGLGLLLAVVGTGVPVAASTGVRLIGISFIWNASMYLWAMTASRTSVDGSMPVTQPTRFAWLVSFAFAWLLGVCLLLGSPPLSLFSLHLLFLGWITTLVYGVGYRLFPLILDRQLPHRLIAFVQLFCSVVGATLMAFAFSPIPSSLAMGAQAMLATLGIGGVLAALGVVTFLVQWLPTTRH